MNNVGEVIIVAIVFLFIYLVIKLIVDHRYRQNLLNRAEIDESVQKVILRNSTGSSGTSSIKWGITLTSLGLAFLIGRLFDSETITLSLLFLFAGVGLLIYYFIEENYLKNQKD